jgi:isoleucyl-tRNA synthetase
LEAAIKVKLKEEDLKIIEGIDLAEVCITSMVKIEMSTTGETSVETSKATGNKCPVCWKINTNTCKRHG